MVRERRQELWTTEDVAHYGAHVEAAIGVDRRQAIHRACIRDLKDEEAEELCGEEAGGGRVAHECGQDVVGVPAPRHAHERLVTVIVLVGVEDELTGAIGAVTGERARGLLHVGVGVIADANGEQLHHLARVILVGLACAVLVVVQPDEHGRIASHSLQQCLEVTERVVPE